ncbi:plasmid-related protein [Pseudomonas amygdali]|nr:plasmid-related protein [Pseudomonas amygdali]
MLLSAPMTIKDSGMRIRGEKELRDAFVQSCRAQDRHAADVLRDFMRAFTEKQLHGQGDLFFGSKEKQI